jgi:hypothetical protein
MLLSILGILVILSAIKGFMPSGIPVTKKKALTGTPAKLVGASCMGAGLLLVLVGVVGLPTFYELLGL